MNVKLVNTTHSKSQFSYSYQLRIWCHVTFCINLFYKLFSEHVVFTNMIVGPVLIAVNLITL